MTFPGDRHLFTRDGPVDVRVFATVQGYSADLLDGSLTAVGTRRKKFAPHSPTDMPERAS